MLEIKHKPMFSEVVKGDEVVARVFEDGNGGLLVKVIGEGFDTTARSANEALKIIEGRLM